MERLFTDEEMKFSDKFDYFLDMGLGMEDAYKATLTHFPFFVSTAEFHDWMVN